MPDNQLAARFDERTNIGLRRVIERSQCIECALILVPGRVLKRVGLGISRKEVLDGGVLKHVLTGLADISIAGNPDSKVEWIVLVPCKVVSFTTVGAAACEYCVGRPCFDDGELRIGKAGVARIGAADTAQSSHVQDLCRASRRIRDNAVDNTVKSIAGVAHVLGQQRRFGRTERAAGSSQCLGRSVERAHEAHPVVTGCASNDAIKEIRISLHRHQRLASPIGAAFEIGPGWRRTISRGHDFKGGGHDRWYREAAEELGGKGIVKCKGGGHSSFILVPGIADDFCVTLSERGHVNSGITPS